jgi:anti-sigma regulatory factor (Ser/Thr protein kinase)
VTTAGIDPVLDITLPSGPAAPGRARDALVGIAESLPDGQRDSLLLLVSEVVTNGVKYGSGGGNVPLQLLAVRRQGALRIEVRDRGEGFEPRIPVPTLYQGSGWGLYLVDQLADAWGVDQANGGGTTVWFELRIASD